jgi:hypothetical protein
MRNVASPVGDCYCRIPSLSQPVGMAFTPCSPHGGNGNRALPNTSDRLRAGGSIGFTAASLALTSFLFFGIFKGFRHLSRGLNLLALPPPRPQQPSQRLCRCQRGPVRSRPLRHCHRGRSGSPRDRRATALPGGTVRSVAKQARKIFCRRSGADARGCTRMGPAAGMMLRATQPTTVPGEPRRCGGPCPIRVHPRASAPDLRQKLACLLCRPPHPAAPRGFRSARAGQNPMHLYRDRKPHRHPCRRARSRTATGSSGGCQTARPRGFATTTPCTRTPNAPATPARKNPMQRGARPAGGRPLPPGCGDTTRCQPARLDPAPTAARHQFRATAAARPHAPWERRVRRLRTTPAIRPRHTRAAAATPPPDPLPHIRKLFRNLNATWSCPYPRPGSPGYNRDHGGRHQ